MAHAGYFLFDAHQRRRFWRREFAAGAILQGHGLWRSHWENGRDNLFLYA
jgi:hypothetical protein